MGISFSNIGTVGREQLITSGGNGEQNWSYIPSKGKSTKKANNRAYQFADEKTKKQIAYMSGYYLQTVPQSVKAAWQETLEETGFNPFQTDVTSILTQLSTKYWREQKIRWQPLQMKGQHICNRKKNFIPCWHLK